MRQIIERIKTCNDSGRIVLVGFLPIAYPSPEQFAALVRLSIEEGVDLIELGVPVADPYLDGEAIREVYKTVVDAGWSTEQLLEIGGQALSGAKGLGFALVYAESIEAYGAEAFFRKLTTEGYSGVLVPNAGKEQRKRYKCLAEKNDLEIMGFVPANSSQGEIEEVIAQSRGFLYMQGVAGATGQQIKVDQAIIQRYENLKKASRAAGFPVLVGFGIRNAEDVASLRDMNTDGAIIGTSFVKAICKPVDQFKQYVQSLSAATHKRKKS